MSTGDTSSQKLELSIIIYTKSPEDTFPSYPNEHHVAILVSPLHHGPDMLYHLYNATEDTTTETDMRYEHLTSSNDEFRKTSRPSHMVVLHTNMTQDRFGRLHEVFENTLVPTGENRPAGWNCQTWVRDAMLKMEASDLLAIGQADFYYSKMMTFIETVADKRQDNLAVGKNTFYG